MEADRSMPEGQEGDFVSAHEFFNPTLFNAQPCGELQFVQVICIHVRIVAHPLRTEPSPHCLFHRHLSTLFAYPFQPRSLKDLLHGVLIDFNFVFRELIKEV